LGHSTHLLERLVGFALSPLTTTVPLNFLLPDCTNEDRITATRPRNLFQLLHVHSAHLVPHTDNTMDSKLPKPTLQAVDGPLASFTLFPKLLIEIRRVIWKLSLPGERYFEFVSMYEPGRCPVSYVHCKNKQIPHMSVCQESRTEALREYKKFRANCTGCPPVYVSPSLDVFCFAGRIMDEVEECLHHTMAQFPIKRLATSAGLGETRELTKECRCSMSSAPRNEEFTNFPVF
jgi:2EXR family